MTLDPAGARVAVIIAIHNNREDLEACLASWLPEAGRGEDAGPAGLVLVVVDDASTDGGGAFVRSRYPWATVLRSESNVGFAGANAMAWSWLVEHEPALEAVALLNADTEASPGWVGELVAVLASDGSVAAVQPTIVLHADPGRINTAGNVSHYLGFGMTTRGGEAVAALGRGCGEVGFASGCAVVLRAEAVRAVGLFDPVFFMHLEDADLGWRCWLSGWRVVHCPAVRVRHRYAAEAPTRWYYELERNRWLVLLAYWPGRALLLLSPMLLAMEAGQTVYAASIGRLGDRMRVWGWLASPRGVGVWRRRRRRWRAERRRFGSMLDRMTGRIELPGGSPWLLRRVGNPVLSGYWAAVRPVLRRVCRGG
jgi:GT2 family glycosyltransferase